MFSAIAITDRVEGVTMSPRNEQATSAQKRLFQEPRSPTEAYRYLRNYLAGQFVGATRDDTLLDEVVKCLFCKLYIELGKVTLPQKEHDDSAAQAAHIRNVFGQIKTDFPEIFAADEEILLGPGLIVQVFKTLSFELLDAASDPIGDAFEVFAGSESRARSGQFFTPRNATDLLVDVIAPTTKLCIIDPACGAGGFLASVIRRWRREGNSKKVVANAASQLVGVDKDSYLVKLARIHIAVLSGGHSQLYCGDSLANVGEDNNISLPVLEPESYDVVLTNPPFGVKIVAASPAVLKKFSLAQKWKLNGDGRWYPTGEVRSKVPPQVLFVERCLSLLKPGGVLGTIIPESVLCNKSYRYVIEYLRAESNVEVVIGMPEALFKTSGKGGTHTKTCILVASKKSPRNRRKPQLFFAEAKWCGKDSRARVIPKDDLPIIREKFAAFKSGHALVEDHLGFSLPEDAIRDNVLCPRYYDPEVLAESNRLAETHQLVTFGDLVQEGTLQLRTGDEVGKLAYGTGEIPFVRTSDISNWEIKINPKHSVERELYESMKAKQDVQDSDVLMVKDGTYLIGTCGLITAYDKEIIYQSHLYKIRVCKNGRGLTPHLLLALLSSKFVQRQIRSKQFTQDIIDSLGERIHELILPIPKAPSRKKKISAMVSKAVEERIEARELAREASIAVLQ